MSTDTDLHDLHDPFTEDGSAEVSAELGTDDADYENDEEHTFAAGEPLFVGDTGQLSIEVRRLLVRLLKERYVSSDRNPKEWHLLLANEPALRTRLNDLFLDLVVDRTYEVAYKKQALPEIGNRFPTVLHDTSYTREETILLVHLRRLLRASQQAGETSVFVDKAALLDEVSHYRPASTTNHVQADRAAENAITSLAKADLLLRTAEEDRYRVAPIIEVLLPVDRVKDLNAWLEGELRDSDATLPTSDDPTGPAEDAADTVNSAEENS